MCHHLHLHRLHHRHLTLFSKPPITQVSPPTALPSSSPTLANPDELDVDASNNNIDESHMASDELQVAPWYNLRDWSTIHPKEKYGFSHVHAVVDEPSTYHEASRIPEW